VKHYLDNPAAMKIIAEEVCARRGWDLHDLLSSGETSKSTSAANPQVQAAFRRWLEVSKLELDYRIFASGSHGFLGEMTLQLGSAREASLIVSCVMIGSHSAGLVDILAVAEDFRDSLLEMADKNPIQVLPTGRLTLHAARKYLIMGQPFQITARLIEPHS